MVQAGGLHEQDSVGVVRRGCCCCTPPLVAEANQWRVLAIALSSSAWVIGVPAAPRPLTLKILMGPSGPLPGDENGGAHVARRRRFRLALRDRA